MGVRLANLDGAAQLITDPGRIDIAKRSSGSLPGDPMELLGRMDELSDWASSIDLADVDGPIVTGSLGPPVPRPSKTFGVGLNYRAHAAEADMAAPSVPLIFTKFPSSLTGPESDVVLPSHFTDWEVELVVVIGRRGRYIDADSALDHVAGFTIGQDISERRVQMATKPPQFSMGKSFDTFAPIGPAVVTLDLLEHPEDLAIGCEVAGETMQAARTADLVFDVPTLIAYLSTICTLEVGDLIFSGTPEGVGAARKPPRFLADGEVLTSTIEGLGSMSNRCVNSPHFDAGSVR